jgi:hypothetical protein
VKTFVGLFLSSTAFGVAIAVAYWFVAHQETTGTVLLGVMAAALLFTAAYAALAERNADLEGDQPNVSDAGVAGEDLGVFTTHSAWPVLLAIASAIALLGTIWSTPVAVAGLAGVLLCLWRLGAESARA